MFRDVTASHAKHPGFYSRHPRNHQNWWHSPVTLLLGDKDMEWLISSLGFVIQLGMWYCHEPDCQ